MDMGLCAYYANPRNKRIAKQAWIEIMQTGTDEVNMSQAKKKFRVDLNPWIFTNL